MYNTYYFTAVDTYKKTLFCRISLLFISLIVCIVVYLFDSMLITKFMNNGENFFGLFILSILGVEIIALAILNILFIIESFTLRLIKEKCHLIGLSLCLITYIVGTITY